MNVLKCETAHYALATLFCTHSGTLMKCLLHDAFMYYLLKMYHSPFVKATALIYSYIIAAVHNIVPVHTVLSHLYYLSPKFMRSQKLCCIQILF